MKWITSDEFHDAMDANPYGVYLVNAYKAGKPVRDAIFSTKAKVEAWTNSLPDEYTCCVCPFVIDEPDFGNIKKDATQ